MTTLEIVLGLRDENKNTTFPLKTGTHRCLVITEPATFTEHTYHAGAAGPGPAAGDDEDEDDEDVVYSICC